MTEPFDSLALETRAIGEADELRDLLEEVCRVTGMGFAAIARVTDTRWIATQVLDKIEFGLKPGDELALKTTICDDIRRCGEAIVIDHVAADIEWRTHKTPMLYGFQSYASFPIFLETGEFFGTLCAIDPEPRSLKAAPIVEMMQRFAKRAAAVLSRRMAEAQSPAD